MTATNTISPRRSNRKRDRHYHGIMVAAEQEFVLKGYGGASVQAIADRVGLPKANIHYYFRHKRILYRCVLERALTLWCEQMGPLDPQADPEVALDRYIRQSEALAAAHPLACRLLIVELLQGTPPLNEWLAGRMRPLLNAERATLQAWMREGRLVAADPDQIIFAIWGAARIGPLLGGQLLASSETVTDEAAGVDRLNAILLRALLPTPSEP